MGSSEAGSFYLTFSQDCGKRHNKAASCIKVTGQQCKHSSRQSACTHDTLRLMAERCSVCCWSIRFEGFGLFAHRGPALQVSSNVDTSWFLPAPCHSSMFNLTDAYKPAAARRQQRGGHFLDQLPIAVHERHNKTESTRGSKLARRFQLLFYMGPRTAADLLLHTDTHIIFCQLSMPQQLNLS